ncbi:TPA: hypothetical protein RFB65_001807 [Yersinia enterocolitica]|nr:hypothetical protein [Yersinia enterocolitica]HDM9019773.1 hypothetical protein [Yersinia enterocolitica]HDU2642822.1 hypothetical protein [Yersinia enterocolitica]HDW8054871.1 hypothetical protein [Yersinia enterocolitica]HDX8417549.1 hypothetical protein [Yersinia enterocolitica]
MLSKEYDIDGRNPWELEPYYSRHVIAMTREELHGKSDIACELAFRDKRIADVEAELLSLREQLAELKALEPIGQIVLSDYDSDGTRTARVVCLHNQADWDNFQDGTLLFTAAKPACSQMAKGRLSDLSI